METSEVLYHWWMWAYHKGAEAFFEQQVEDDDDWLREHNEELGLCPTCGEEWCRSAH